jgi:prevent-host-death family protein
MDLRKHLGEILDQAAAGERIVIERDRRPMAVLLPYSAQALTEETDEERQARVESALDALRRLGERIRASSPDGPDAVMAIRMDRDHGHTPDRRFDERQ